MTAEPTRPVSVPGRSASRYWRMWINVPRELAAILSLAVIAVVSFGVCWALFTGGIMLLPPFLIGVLVLVSVLYAARGLGVTSMVVIEWAGRPRIDRSAWKHGRGFFGRLRTVLAGPRYWLSLSYTLLPQFVLATATLLLASIWTGIAFGGTFWAAWSWSLPPRGDLNHYGLPDAVLDQWFGGDPYLLEGVVITVAGLVCLATLPFVTRGIAWAHWGLARGMLGASRSERRATTLAGQEIASPS